MARPLGRVARWSRVGMGWPGGRAIIGGAIAASQPWYGYDYAPGYYGYSYAPGYSYGYDPGYSYGYDPGSYSYGYSSGNGDVAYCMQRFRSYDPASRTYLGYDGIRHPCP